MIDDDEEVLLAAKMLLKKSNHQVIIEKNPNKIPFLLNNDSYDAILLDLSLPDAYGIPTLKQVQATSPTIPIIVLSSVSDQTLSIQAVQQGAQDYLVKGQGHPDLLARSIRYAIERKRAEEALRGSGREAAGHPLRVARASGRESRGG